MTADPRYPVGRLELILPATEASRRKAVEELAALPAQTRDAVSGLTDAQLDTPYRLGGWTVRQVVHHLSDSHMHAYARMKLALTEHEPTITPYDERAWADLADSRLPVAVSLGRTASTHGGSPSFRLSKRRI